MVAVWQTELSANHFYVQMGPNIAILDAIFLQIVLLHRRCAPPRVQLCVVLELVLQILPFAMLIPVADQQIQTVCLPKRLAFKEVVLIELKSV